MKTINNLVAIGSIIAATGCVENVPVTKQTTPVVIVDGESSLRDVRLSSDGEKHGLQEKEVASDPVKVILESNKKYRDAMEIINPIVKELNNVGWDGDAQCHHEPVILAMQKKNRDITEMMNKVIEEEIKNGLPDMELRKCLEGTGIADDCGKRLNSSELGRLFVEVKQATGEYYRTLAECYRKEFKFAPIKKP